MNQQRTWLDHTVYKVYQNRDRSWEAAILVPTNQEPAFLKGLSSPSLTVKKVEEAHGESAERLSEAKFQEELERRRTHSPEMLAMLKQNWTGEDLSGWHVYASVLRPMMGIKIEGTVFLNGNGAKYEGYEIYTYVVSKEPLDARTREQYSLVTISHP